MDIVQVIHTATDYDDVGAWIYRAKTAAAEIERLRFAGGDDLVVQLRAVAAEQGPGEVRLALRAAADEIQRLREELEWMESASENHWRDG